MTQTATDSHLHHGPRRTVVTVSWSRIDSYKQERETGGVFWAQESHPVRFELLWGIGRGGRKGERGGLIHVDCAAALDPVPYMGERAKRALCKLLLAALEAETGFQASQDALPLDRLDLLHV